MVPNAWRKSNKKITIIAGGAVAAALAWMLLGSVYDRSVAATTSFVEAAPVAESSEIIGIQDVTTLSTISEKNDVSIEAVKDDAGLSFVMTNAGQNSVSIDVESWTSSLTGPFDLQEGAEVAGIEKSFVLKAGESVVLHSIYLDKYQTIFELFPGEYTAELSGWNWKTKDFGAFTKQGNFEDYFIRANVTIGYDMDMLKASPNKLLKVEDAAMTSEGNGSALFEVGDESPRTISLYIVNNKDTRISAVASGSTFEIWNSEYRFPGKALMMSASPFVWNCTFLEPGESKKVDVFEFSKSGWPIAGADSVAELLSSDDAIPGTYMIYYTYSTQSCKLNSGEEVPGEHHSLIAAIEVVP